MIVMDFILRRSLLQMFLILTLLLTLCASCRAGDADFKAQLSTTVDVRALTSSRYDGSEARPLLVFLHGYCLSDDAQQTLKLESMRNVPAVRNRLGIARRRQQTLVQSGLREAALDRNWIYLAPRAPRTTRECVLCNLQESSPNSQDRLFGSWITGILARDSPEFECRAWDGSDAVALPEISATDDLDVKYILEVVAAAKKEFNVDEKRIYVVGIATGGFMASRLACEKPELFRGVVSLAGGTFSDASRCRPKSGETNVLLVHGTDDHTVPIDGGVNARGIPFPSADDSFSTLGKAMECANVVAKGMDTLPADGNSVEVRVAKAKYDRCENNVDVEQWKLNGVDHFIERETSEALFYDVVTWLNDLD